MTSRLQRLSACIRSPLGLILCGVLVLHAVGLCWGLPSTDGWDDDGVAPRDFLVGVVRTFTPGDFYTYPPLHVLLLTALTWPLWIVGLVRAPSLSQGDLIHEFLNVRYMTAFALVARAVAVTMSLGVVYALAKVAEEIRGPRAGLFSAVVVGLNAPFAYYAHTSNLEVPYCCWASFALLYFARALARRNPAELRWAGAFAAFAISTKDQAAALFVLGFPLGLAAWFALDSWARAHARAVWRQAAIASALAIGLVAVIDGAIFNPTGFRARLGFLFGTASRDHASYAATLAGRLFVLRDSALAFSHFYPAPFAVLVIVGVAAAGGSPSKRAAGLLPLFLTVSFLSLFNCLARRTDERFLLPQMLFLGVYAGLGLDAAFSGVPRSVATLVRAGSVLLLVWALYQCAAVDVNLLDDPRYDAEAWLSSHVQPGDSLEVYGNLVYLPRLPPQARVVRVDQKPIDKRNPLPGAREVLAPFENVEDRRPHWIVLTETQAWPYLVEAADVARMGRTLTPGQRAAQNDPARKYFRDLVAGQGGYRVAHVSEWTSKFWPLVQIHASTGQRVHIFERLNPG
jgi:dolichyl-phosphate-mannose-protein mannosyltransferase